MKSNLKVGSATPTFTLSTEMLEITVHSKFSWNGFSSVWNALCIMLREYNISSHKKVQIFINIFCNEKI